MNVLAVVGTTVSKRVPLSHKKGKRYIRTKTQVLELEANSILWSVVLRP